MRRDSSIAMFYLLVVMAACMLPTKPVESEPDVCYAPWLEDAYKDGRAIPAPSPEAIIPICGETQ